jgi:3-isopropylmalate dehydrogenase
MTCKIAVLRGDGIGPEVVEAALSVLVLCVPIQITEGRIGGDAIDAVGDPLPAETLDLCLRSDAVLLGAVGGPRWEGPLRAEAGLLRLRRGLGLHSNLRPARNLGIETPLRAGLVRGADILVVRDLAGGVYYGEPRGISDEAAFNTWRQTADEVRQTARVAFELARRRRRKVTSVDKANVLEASRLWRRVVSEVAATYPDVDLEHRYVDAASFELLQAPRRFDVVVTENLFGDILSDELAAVVGSIGLLPSASFGAGPSLYEPVHGSAPTLVGGGLANPVGAILSVALLLEHTLRRPDLSRAVEDAVAAALQEVRTPDVGGHASSDEVTDAIRRHLSWKRSGAPEETVSSTEWAV